MPDPLQATDPAFWQQRLRAALAAGRDPQAAVYDVTPETWRQIQEATRGVIEEVLGIHGPADAERYRGAWLLDVGCGIGSLCEVVPGSMTYLGFDVCQEFINIARERYGVPATLFNKPGVPRRHFIQWDVRDGLGNPAGWTTGFFTLAVCRSIEGTVCNALPPPGRDAIKQELRRVARRVLYIGYNDEAVQQGLPPLDWYVEEGSCG